MMTVVSKEFCSLIETNFERSSTTGIIQLFSAVPEDRFFVTVGASTVSFAEGTSTNPRATITLRGTVLQDLVTKGDEFDARVVEFSSRLSISGDTAFATALLNLVKRPSSVTVARLKAVKERWRRRTIQQIERVNGPGKSFIRTAMAESRPMIITGILNEWSVSGWSPAKLQSLFGSNKLVSYLPWTIRTYTEPTSGQAPQEDAPSYTNGVGLPGVFWKHFRPPTALVDTVSLGFPQLWLGRSKGPAKAVTSLHCDCEDGFLCQVFGRKRVLLYSPDQESLVYPFRAFNKYRPCWTGPDALNDEQFPLFRQAHSIETILGPGEVLFIPLGWFHCVFALDSVMSISYAVEPSPLVSRMETSA